MKQFWNKEIKLFHLFYVLAISILIIAILFIILLAPKISNEAFQNFSFASTVVSIVLAIISIIFSMWYSRDINKSFDKFSNLRMEIQDEVSKISSTNFTNNILDSEIKIFVGHDSVNVPQLIRNARHYLFFHAAYYPKYGIDEHGEIIKEVMKKNEQLKLKAVFIVSKQNWGTEFARILRSHFDNQKYESALNESRKLFEIIKETYGERVEIINSDKLPMYPIIMIDDTLVVGFYSHSRFSAPQGIWLTIHTPQIMYMYEQLILHGKDNIDTSNFKNEEKAIFRFIEEIFTIGTTKK